LSVDTRTARKRMRTSKRVNRLAVGAASPRCAPKHIGATRDLAGYGLGSCQEHCARAFDNVPLLGKSIGGTHFVEFVANQV